MTALPPRIETKIMPEPNSGCWIWLGGTNQKNYGHIWSSELKRHERAHRMVYEILNSPIPVGLHLLHRCDNPYCVNPDHMFVGTNAENMADRDAKGRQASGARNGNARLTEDKARQILLAPGTITEIARQFGISRTNVRDIKTRRIWKNLEVVL